MAREAHQTNPSEIVDGTYQETPRKLTGELLFLLAGLSALGALATNIILPAFADMSVYLRAPVTDLSATLSTFFLVFAVGQLFVGPLSDRFGRHGLVLFGLIVFAAGSAVCVFAETLPQLIVGRVIQALGVCATSVLSRAIARDLFDGEALARALSLVMIAMASAPGFSPLLGGVLTSLLGWQSTFWFVGLLAVVLAVVYVFRLGETHHPHKRSPISVLATLRTYQRLMVDRRFIVPALSVSLVLGALYAFFALAPAVLMTGFQWSSIDLGLFFAASVFVVFAAGFIAPRAAQRWGQARAARAGIVIALAGGVALLAGPEDIIFFAASMTVFFLGMGLVNPLGTAIALHPFGRQAGAASALLGFMQMGCAALSISVGAALPVSPYTSLGIVLTANLIVSFLIFRLLKRR